ncbi:MAG: FAD-dependent oxidoreductase, partial [Treponema sp.]|nr:FAD-dependent oxidoreductase [Treponema sp.]
HNGFGLHHFHEELTGPEYAGRFIERLAQTGIELKLDTMVLEITPEKAVHLVNTTDGYRIVQAKSIVLAMGCRERTRGAIGTPGTRPAGVYTAGTAQRLLNIDGYMVGRRVLIIGSGDIGLIMARRMALEGAQVLACVEIQPFSGGLTRNIVQCLDDFGIPLYLSHTITEIKGTRRVTGATVMQLDNQRQPIVGTAMEFDCDTILLSVGLIPENELTQKAGIVLDERTKGAVVYENRETSLPGVFACGNVVHVHDLVDYVTEEAVIAGAGAAAYIKNQRTETDRVITVTCGHDISYTVPQRIRPNLMDAAVDIFFRVQSVHREPSVITVTTADTQDTELAQFKRRHLAPGEMGRIQLTKAQLAHAADTICISVQAGDTA